MIEIPHLRLHEEQAYALAELCKRPSYTESLPLWARSGRRSPKQECG